MSNRIQRTLETAKELHCSRIATYAFNSLPGEWNWFRCLRVASLVWKTEGDRSKLQRVWDHIDHCHDSDVLFKAFYRAEAAFYH